MSLDDAVVQAFKNAFSHVSVPERWTHCLCDECQELGRRIEDCGPEELKPETIGSDVCLLSPEAFQYLLPKMVRLALRDLEFETSISLLWQLCEPISKSLAPDRFPRCPQLTLSQCEAILLFLYRVKDCEHSNSEFYAYDLEPSKQIQRGIRNWTRFLSHSAPRTTTH